MIIEIVGRNQSFFRRVNAKAFEKLARSVPSHLDWTIAELDRLHKGLWQLGKPARISSTGDVEATVIDDQDDIENSQGSWEELFQSYVDEDEFS